MQVYLLKRTRWTMTVDKNISSAKKLKQANNTLYQNTHYNNGPKEILLSATERKLSNRYN
jgi:hypothetical protein